MLKFFFLQETLHVELTSAMEEGNRLREERIQVASDHATKVLGLESRVQQLEEKQQQDMEEIA